ncbi:Fur family transcriptional regulator [Nocardioides sp. SYSU D00065]|uniref:Fur family transcriptional regulator n=1 Tax=Nocardioides sp. SYSU D00065 TaxID=2817378 RepID=UPI0027DDBC29|nr:Fur family transcriptional regulator [Nocardioides sp. SYSU D00065]
MSATEQRSAAPQRSTRQRRALAALLNESDDFHSAQEIHEILRERGEAMGIATVYRTLSSMAEAGDVDVLNHSGEAIYRRCSTEHHHHLVCRQCGRTVEIAGPAVERWTQSVSREHGFTDVSHSLELFGLCPVCQQA